METSYILKGKEFPILCYFILRQFQAFFIHKEYTILMFTKIQDRLPIYIFKETKPHKNHYYQLETENKPLFHLDNEQNLGVENRFCSGAEIHGSAN